MAIKTNLFGNRFNNADNVGSSVDQTTEQRAPAKFWLNIGFMTGNEERPFISLQRKGVNGNRDSGNGIPLSLEDIREPRGSIDYQHVMQAENELLEDLVAAAETLEPGETAECEIVGLIPGLCVQLRRVNDETVHADPTANPLSRRRLEANEQPAAE